MGNEGPGPGGGRGAWGTRGGGLGAGAGDGLAGRQAVQSLAVKEGTYVAWEGDVLGAPVNEQTDASVGRS